MRFRIINSRTGSFIFDALKPFPKSIIVMILYATLWAASISILPLLLKHIINIVIENPELTLLQTIIPTITYYLAMNLSLIVMGQIYHYTVNIGMVPHLREKIANEALSLLLDKSHNFFQNTVTGTLANKISNLTASVPEILKISIDKLLAQSLAVIFAIITLAHADYKFSILMLIWSLCFMFGALFLTKLLSRLSRNWGECNSTVVGKIVDILSNINVVRLFTAKAHEQKSLGLIYDKAVAAEQKLEWTFFCIWAYYGLSSFLLMILNFYFLLEGRKHGTISVGDFALVLTINMAILDMLWKIAQDLLGFSRTLGRVQQSLRSILEAPKTTDSKNALPLTVTKGEIIFDQVKFNHKGSDTLFQNKNVIIEGGQKVGLVGYSGSGKTTFLNLILRLYDVTDGQILIDGQNIKDVTQESLRAAIGMIPQDPSLFHRSFFDNIRYGAHHATDKQVIAAAKQAHAHEFIIAQKKGYETIIGDRGVKLSGGQRQLISLARAILKNAPILIMDEATSQLDALTEKNIQISLQHLMQGKTTIVVAHRLATILTMDRILVFQDGMIVQDGTHKQLIETDGVYSELWEAQTNGLLPSN